MHPPATQSTPEARPQIPWKFSDMVRAVMWVAFGLLLMNAILWNLDIESSFESIPSKSLITLGLFLLQEVILLVPLYLVIVRKHRVSASSLGFFFPPFKVTLKLVLQALAMSIAALFIVAYFTLYSGEALLGFGEQESHIPLFGENLTDTVIATVVLVILAPVVEELFFRGFILQSLLLKFRPLYASIFAALFFTIVHFEFASGGMILILAFILNWLFLKSRSLVPGIAFHLVNNAIAFAMEWLVWNGKIPL